MDLTRLKTLSGLGEASTVNGVKQKATDMVWKSTQMSKDEAIAKYGKENVKVGMFKRGTGEEDVQVRMPLGEGQMKHQLEDIASEMELEDFVANAGDYGMDEQEAVEFWQVVNGLDEAVGQFAEAYFDLIDRVGGDVSLVNNEALAYLGSRARYDITDGDDNYEDYMSADDVANEITRYMDGDTIKDFVAHFERHYDLNSEEEMEESIEEYTLEAVDVEEEELTEAPTMDTTQLVNMLRNAGLNEEAIAQKLEEWANTPEGVGEVEPTEHGDAYDFAQGVNLSLKRYLDAQDMKVSVNESHTAESLMEAYAAYKGDEVMEEADEELEEAAKPDFADIDGDGDEEETAKKAAKDKEEKEEVKESEEVCDACGKSPCECDDVKESTEIDRLRRLSGL